MLNRNGFAGIRSCPTQFCRTAPLWRAGRATLRNPYFKRCCSCGSRRRNTCSTLWGEANILGQERRAVDSRNLWLNDIPTYPRVQEIYGQSQTVSTESISWFLLNRWDLSPGLPSPCETGRMRTRHAGRSDRTHRIGRGHVIQTTGRMRCHSRDRSVGNISPPSCSHPDRLQVHGGSPLRRLARDTPVRSLEPSADLPSVQL